MIRQTLKEKKFCAAYLGEANGNATEAAKIAGYKGNRNVLGGTGHAILKKPKTAAALYRKVCKDPHIASAKDILHFWTNTMEGSDFEMGYRLGASDRLAKVHRLVGGDSGDIPQGYECKRLTIMELREVENRVLEGNYIDEDTTSKDKRDEDRDDEG